MGHFQQNFHYLSTMGEYWASCCISTGSLLIKAVGVPLKVSSSTSYSGSASPVLKWWSSLESRISLTSYSVSPSNSIGRGVVVLCVGRGSGRWVQVGRHGKQGGPLGIVVGGRL